MTPPRRFWADIQLRSVPILTMMDGMGWTSPEAHELFNLVVRHQADERRKQREQLSEH